jgi:hypothetical protein
MIADSKKFYDEQIQASKDWAEQQSQLQQEQTDFTLQQIEQQKAQAQKDYTKQQSAAYVDYKKQSNAYGAEAEQMAGAGLQRTGYSESSQVAMYNAYQNRVAAAKQSIDQAVMNYNNLMTQAQMQNNAALAEIAANALQQQLSLSLQGFQYENSLLLQQEEQRQAYENIYYNRYLDVLNQINAENALAEQIRQINQTQQEEQKDGLLVNDSPLWFLKDLNPVYNGQSGIAAAVNAIAVQNKNNTGKNNSNKNNSGNSNSVPKKPNGISQDAWERLFGNIGGKQYRN